MMLGLSLNTANWWINFIVSIGFFLGFVWGTFKTINQVKQFLHHRIASKPQTSLPSASPRRLRRLRRNTSPITARPCETQSTASKAC